MTIPDFGVFARVFPPGSPQAVATAVAAAGYRLTQLNLRVLGLPTIPSNEEWSGIDPSTVRSRFAVSGVRIWGLSCTYNMIHPDVKRRRANTLAATLLIARAARFGATVVTLCTGSRDPEHMWTAHPENASASAWRDLRAELEVLLDAAQRAGVVLAVEPEPGNVVRDASAAVRLCDELGGDAQHVGVILDSANLVFDRPVESHRDILERSFRVLAARTLCLHAKDLVPWGQTLDGRGRVDYDLVASLYERLGLSVPVIVQDVTPTEAPLALAFLRQRFGLTGSRGATEGHAGGESGV